MRNVNFEKAFIDFLIENNIISDSNGLQEVKLVVNCEDAPSIHIEKIIFESGVSEFKKISTTTHYRIITDDDYKKYMPKASHRGNLTHQSYSVRDTI